MLNPRLINNRGVTGDSVTGTTIPLYVLCPKVRVVTGKLYNDDGNYLQLSTLGNFFFFRFYIVGRLNRGRRWNGG